MEQETGIRSLYDEFFRGDGAEIRLSCPDFRPNWTYKSSYILGHRTAIGHVAFDLCPVLLIERSP